MLSSQGHAVLRFLSEHRSNSAVFVYSEYLTSVGSSFRPVIWQIAEDYAKAEMLLRLPGYTPTPAFREVIDVPLVARLARKTGSQVGNECQASALETPAPVSIGVLNSIMHSF